MIIAEDHVRLPWDLGISVASANLAVQFQIWDWCVDFDLDSKFYCSTFDDSAHYISRYWFTDPQAALIFRLRWAHAIL